MRGSGLSDFEAQTQLQNDLNPLKFDLLNCSNRRSYIGINGLKLKTLKYLLKRYKVMVALIYRFSTSRIWPSYKVSQVVNHFNSLGTSVRKKRQNFQATWFHACHHHRQNKRGVMAGAIKLTEIISAREQAVLLFFCGPAVLPDPVYSESLVL